MPSWPRSRRTRARPVSQQRMKPRTAIRQAARLRKIRRKLDARDLQRMGIQPDQKPAGLRKNPGAH